MQNPEIEKQCLNSITVKLGDALRDQSSFDRASAITKEGPVHWSKMTKPKWIAFGILMSICAFLGWMTVEMFEAMYAALIETLNNSFNEVALSSSPEAGDLTPNEQALANAELMLASIFKLVALVTLIGCWVRFVGWQIALVLIIPNDYPTYNKAYAANDFTHESMMTLISKFQDKDADAGRSILKVIDNPFIFEQPIDKNLSPAMAMIISEVGDADDAYSMSQFAKKYLSGNEYYISLKTAESKGSLKAAREIAELVAPPQATSSSGGGWLLAGLALGIVIS